MILSMCVWYFKLSYTFSRLGYTQQEIDLFLSRYNIDPEAEIDQEEMNKLLKNKGKVCTFIKLQLAVYF